MSQIFFLNFKYMKKYLQNCVWLSYLFPFQKRFAKTDEFRPSKAGPCLKADVLKNFDVKLLVWCHHEATSNSSTIPVPRQWYRCLLNYSFEYSLPFAREFFSGFRPSSPSHNIWIQTENDQQNVDRKISNFTTKKSIFHTEDKANWILLSSIKKIRRVSF